VRDSLPRIPHPVPRLTTTDRAARHPTMPRLTLPALPNLALPRDDEQDRTCRAVRDLNLPNQTGPAAPHQTSPRQTSPHLPNRTFPCPAAPRLNKPNLPNLTKPERAMPCLAVPALPHETSPLLTSPAVPCRTPRDLTQPNLPHLTWPSQAARHPTMPDLTCHARPHHTAPFLTWPYLTCRTVDILAHEAAMDKLDKKAVNYRPSEGDQRCGSCSMIRMLPPDFESAHCTLVEGLIDPDYVCDHWEAQVEKSAETPRLEATPHQLGPHGLWHTPSKKVPVKQKLPNYIENIAHALMRDQGMDESKAIAMAIAAVKRWAAGDLKWGPRRHVHPEVIAASRRALEEWEKLKESHH